MHKHAQTRAYTHTSSRARSRARTRAVGGAFNSKIGTWTFILLEVSVRIVLSRITPDLP